MPFLDSLDIANSGLQSLGANPILSVTEDSVNNLEMSACYDKLRRAELRRNVWRFAIRRTALRAMTTTTLVLIPAQYDATKTYLLGEIVADTNSLLWISQIPENFNSAPGGNNTSWDMYFGPMTADVWSATTTYFSGELAYVVSTSAPNGYQVYMSLTNSNAAVPGTADAWSATTQYKQDDTASYGGYQWRSLLPINLNTTPAVGPSPFDIAATYASSNTVTASDNYIYSSVGSGNVGHDPTTDGGVHWTNTGVLTAWEKTPTILVSSKSWRAIVATLANVPTIYPIGCGPLEQSSTRNVFRLPCGFLREAPQNPKSPGYGPVGGPTGIGVNDWAYEGNFIVSGDTGPIIFRFVADVTKVTDMDDMFCVGLGERMAKKTCYRITQSTAKEQLCEQNYKDIMGQARIVNGIEIGPQYPPDDEFLTVRY